MVILRSKRGVATLPVVEEGKGIYRGEVIEMMGAIADIRVAVFEILRYIEGEDDESEEEEEDPGEG
jgi:hypothetical protein